MSLAATSHDAGGGPGRGRRLTASPTVWTAGDLNTLDGSGLRAVLEGEHYDAVVLPDKLQ